MTHASLGHTEGSGRFIATDRINEAGQDRDFQRIKQGYGAEDTWTPVSTANPLPVVTPGGYVEITPTLDTVAYTVDDVLFVATLVSGVVPAAGMGVMLQTVLVVDKDKQMKPLRLFFFDRNVTFGTLNGAVSISDADAAFSMGFVDILASDYEDLINNAIAEAVLRNGPIKMKTNTANLYVAGRTKGTPTHSASGLVLKFGFV